MKAVTWRGKRDVRVDNVPDPVIKKSTDAIVRITTTAICGFDLGAALFCYSKLCGRVAGAQAEYLRVPHANYGPIKVPHGPPDEQFIYLSDVLPTAWQAVEYAAIPYGGSVTVLGLGPIGQFCARIALHRDHRMIAVDLVAERLELARRRGIEVLDLREVEDVADAIRDMTDGRGTDSVIDAVGMEAHGSPASKFVQTVTGFLSDAVAQKMMEKAGVDRLNALYLAIDIVRRGGTISLIGVYGGQADPLPMLTLFDKQIHLHMGQANVRRWTDSILPLLTAGDPLGVSGFATAACASAARLRDLPEEAGRCDQGSARTLNRPRCESNRCQ